MDKLDLKADRNEKARGTRNGTCPTCSRAIIRGQRRVGVTATQVWHHATCLAGRGPDPDDDGPWHDSPPVPHLREGEAQR